MKIRFVCLVLIVFSCGIPVLMAADTLVPLRDGKAPQSVEALRDWSEVMELKLAPKHKGDPRPELRNLRWAVDGTQE
jgi:hypothetical protein